MIMYSRDQFFGLTLSSVLGVLEAEGVGLQNRAWVVGICQDGQHHLAEEALLDGVEGGVHAGTKALGLGAGLAEEDLKRGGQRM